VANIATLSLRGIFPGRVVALTETTAAIQNVTGNITTYRKNNKPALGPVGDSLDDLDPPFGGRSGASPCFPSYT
jgi:hypothetical protein